MDQSTSFAHSSVVLPPPPPPPLTHATIVGPTDEPSNNTAFANSYYANDIPAYVPGMANHGTGYGLNAAIPQDHRMAPMQTRQGESTVFSFPTANGPLPQNPADVTRPFTSVSNRQEPSQVSPITVSQTPIMTRPATGLISPKRGGDRVNALFNNKRRGFSKRQRLDLTIETATPTKWADQYSQQPNYYRAASPRQSSVINSMDYGSTGIPLSASSLDRSRSNSNAIPGLMPRLQAPWTALPQEPNYSHARFHDESTQHFHAPPFFESQRHSTFSNSSQNLPTSSSGYDSRFSSLSNVAGLSYGAAQRMNPYDQTRQSFDVTAAKPKQLSDGRFSLIVQQQPERARLCSFKEENDTIDRRPVDPPPVVQIIPTRGGSISEMLVRHHFFMKAVLVSQKPEYVMDSATSPSRNHTLVYQELRLPAGQEATTGEATHTPEKLQDLDGKDGAFCVFGRLSIRMPGQFRLRFTLYEATQLGIQEVAHVYSEPFEVFSPKLFTGMRQSTTLTRHFASQGLKIKLRQDGTGRGGRRKKIQPRESTEAGLTSLRATEIPQAHSKVPSQSIPRQDSQVSPTSTSFAPPYSATVFANPQSSAQRNPSSISTISYHLNPHDVPKDSSAIRYPISTGGAQHVTPVQQPSSAFSQRSSTLGAYVPDDEDVSYHRSGPRNDALNHSSDDNIQSIDSHLDLSSNDSRREADAPQHMRSFSSAMEVDLPKLRDRATSSSFDKGSRTLPSLNTAVDHSSIWLRNANLVPPDDLVPGGIIFRNGIRYGGDDGSMPPMSFGKLPNLIYEGLLPGTPGVPNANGTDLSNFSLKNGSSNFALTPYLPMTASAPSTPSIPLNPDLTPFLANGNLNTPRSRLEINARPDQPLRTYRPGVDVPASATYLKDFSKPSQFADLEDNPDAASANDLAGFSSALSSSLENKVRNFNLALPRRASRESRDSRRSSDEQHGHQIQTVASG
ncbi:hypothetical protein NliqN6_3193 [Naganishia liquefaciens]|uniref:Velvet domain-containing protein n=1 Tax=Naganishia liquefaciens TaxID=104408 RepID=A0A8H3TST4_9TREE|nr:hypothetical protein NliqN6_3193 [Naganishia liquefaciens]